MFSLSHIVLIHFLASFYDSTPCCFLCSFCAIWSIWSSHSPKPCRNRFGQGQKLLFLLQESGSESFSMLHIRNTWVLYLGLSTFIPHSHSIFFLHSSMAHWRPVVFSRESAVAKPTLAFLCAYRFPWDIHLPVRRCKNAEACEIFLYLYIFSLYLGHISLFRRLSVWNCRGYFLDTCWSFLLCLCPLCLCARYWLQGIQVWSKKGCMWFDDLELVKEKSSEGEFIIQVLEVCSWCELSTSI